MNKLPRSWPLTVGALAVCLAFGSCSDPDTEDPAQNGEMPSPVTVEPRNTGTSSVVADEPRFVLIADDGKPMLPFGSGPNNRMKLIADPTDPEKGSWDSEGAGFRIAMLIGNNAGTFGGAGVELRRLGYHVSRLGIRKRSSRAVNHL